MPQSAIDVRANFRSAMARLGAAVNVVTTDGVAGRHGLTVSAVCSVTDAPPTLLVCVNRSAAANAKLKANGVLCVNVLAGCHQELSAYFAGQHANLEVLEEDVWKAWVIGETGSPKLVGAIVAFDCRITDVQEVGTHSVFYCEVNDIDIGSEGGGLIWYDRRYHHLHNASIA